MASYPDEDPKPEDVRHYTDSGGLHCAYCNAPFSQLEIGQPQIDGPVCWCTVECDACGANYRDIYVLSAIAVTNADGKYKTVIKPAPKE